MLIPKKARLTVYQHLFQEGVLTAKKDFNAPKHHELDVRNLYVIKMMLSFKSKGFVTERFAWQWYYWILTNEGITYLRDFLHIPSQEVVPATLKKPRVTAPRPVSTRPEGGRGFGRGGDRPSFEGRGEKKAGSGPDADYQPSFRGEGRGRGFGRGRGRGDSYRRDDSSGRGDRGYGRARGRGGDS